VQDFTGFEPVVNTVDDINRTSLEAGLEEVIAKDITQLLDRQGQQHSNEDLKDVVKELIKQKKDQKGKEEEPPLKCMKTSDIQHSFSAMETLSGEL
jgi:hypothetical protein